LANSSIQLFQSSNDHSYKCNAETSIMFNGTNTVAFKDVHVQPYDIKSNGDFSTGKISRFETNFCVFQNNKIRIIIVYAGLVS